MPLQIDLPWSCSFLLARRGFTCSICLSQLYVAIKQILSTTVFHNGSRHDLFLFPCSAMLAPGLQNPRSLLSGLTWRAVSVTAAMQRRRRTSTAGSWQTTPRRAIMDSHPDTETLNCRLDSVSTSNTFLRFLLVLESCIFTGGGVRGYATQLRHIYTLELEEFVFWGYYFVSIYEKKSLLPECCCLFYKDQILKVCVNS